MSQAPPQAHPVDPTLARVAARFGLTDEEAASIIPPDTPEVRAFCARWQLAPALVWGLVIDAAKLDLGFGYRFPNQGISDKLGPLSFENEQGYLRGMLQGFAFMLSTLGQPLTGALLRDLHDAAVRGVLRVTGEPFGLGYIRRPWSYGFIRNVDGKLPMLPAITQEGWREIFEERLIYYRYRRWVDPCARHLWSAAPREQHLVRIKRLRKSSGERLEPTWRCRKGPELQAEVDARLEEALRSFREASASATGDPAAQLTAMARLCRKLELLHVFPDGNCRTMCFLLLPKLLLEAGFPPVILGTPHIFDGYYGSREMVALIVHGFKNFRRLRDAYA